LAHYTEKENSTFLPINEGIVSGTIAIGIGHSQLAELSATIDILYMSPTSYFKVQTILSKKIHDVAMYKMLIAGEKEKKNSIGKW
jgi:hypothetical protein